MLIPDSINPDNQTRSYARLDYFDTVINTRQNLHVATHQHVTRVLVDAAHDVRSRDYPTDLWISGIEVRKIPIVMAFLIITSSWQMGVLLLARYHAQGKLFLRQGLFTLPRFLSYLAFATQPCFRNSTFQLSSTYQASGTISKTILMLAWSIIVCIYSQIQIHADNLR